MRVVILLCSSCSLRIGAIPSLSMSSCEEVKDLYKITVYENEPEEYIVFCTSECKKSIQDYISMRKHYGETISKTSPLVREQFDRRDQFAAANPRRIKEAVLARKLTDLAQAAGIRTKVQLEEGQKPASVRSEIPICNGFRRFYCGKLVDSGLTTEKRWLLEGHNLKANDSAYLKVTPEDLLAQYELAHDILVIEPSMRLQRKVEKLEVERSQFDKLAAEIIVLKQKVM